MIIITISNSLQTSPALWLLCREEQWENEKNLLFLSLSSFQLLYYPEKKFYNSLVETGDAHNIATIFQHCEMCTRLALDSSRLQNTDVKLKRREREMVR